MLTPDELVAMRKALPRTARKELMAHVDGQAREIRILRDALQQIGSGLSHNPQRLARDTLATTYVTYHGPTPMPPDQED